MPLRFATDVLACVVGAAACSFGAGNKEQKSVAWRASDKQWDDLEHGLRLPYVCEWE